jgi:hypothetical protein
MAVLTVKTTLEQEDTKSTKKGKKNTKEEGKSRSESGGNT